MHLLRGYRDIAAEAGAAGIVPEADALCILAAYSIIKKALEQEGR